MRTIGKVLLFSATFDTIHESRFTQQTFLLDHKRRKITKFISLMKGSPINKRAISV